MGSGWKALAFSKEQWLALLDTSFPRFPYWLGVGRSVSPVCLFGLEEEYPRSSMFLLSVAVTRICL